MRNLFKGLFLAAGLALATAPQIAEAQVTNTVNNYAREQFMTGTMLLSTNDVRVALFSANPVTTNWNGSTGTRYYSTTSELATGCGYTQGGVALASKTFGYTAGGNYYFSSAAAQWTASGCSIAASYAVIYNNTVGAAGTRPILTVIYLGGTQTATSGGTFTITPAATGWFYL